ncbi:PREDICTED: coiled-coil domain-containing protein 112 [Crocodylus porosus]|uniref:Coiled-coil domain containing 112 n=1 Tax=Crocodylus porosus TaxID=8502 RepID=A0A7M4FCD3_CROPO|nr:PREDICTED: coiled-coil domain-containing protein 112 [Crocodylus porosus]XP_019410746.1 PREDICTED: coiled-coil domain-containing protein 112 [Crocodylus porosus]
MAALATAVAAAASGHQQSDSCFSTPGARQHFPFQNWKMKAEQVKKVEFIRTAEKLKNQFATVEKDKNGHLYSKKSDFRMEYSTLEELERKMTNGRKAERAKIEQQLSKIHHNVKRLQCQLKDVKPTPEFVEKLREMMEEVENAINAFKEEQRQIYEELLKEEKIATNELSALEKKIEMWALGSTAAERVFQLPSGKISVDKTLQNHLPEEVVEFEKFLQRSGGRQGGWDDYDHQLFLQIWTKHKGRASYIDEVLECLSGRTKEDILQHEEWYQEFQILQERKKESIQKWKQKKQQEKDEILKQKEKSEEILRTAHLQHDEVKKQKAEEERKMRQAAVEAWKQHKAIEFAMKQASKLKEEKEKQKKQEKERQRQFQLKLVLEEYTLQKKEKEELQRLEKEKREEAEREEKKRLAAEEISKFQERDLHKLELKMLEKQVKEEEKLEKEKRLAKLREKVEVHVTRDPSRLYKPTKGWEEHTKEIGPTGAKPLLHIPRRAIPTWRQGL